MAAGAMNYIGTISVLERAAAPAQAVLDRNARSRAQRHAEETKEELTKVMDRVENIYGNFELDNVIFENKYSGMEYVEDLEKLQAILQDQVKKKQYQQQITIFVVGVQNAGVQKLRLLKQVNEFFMENTKKMEEEEEEERDTPSKSPEHEMDNVQETIEDTLRTTEDLMLRLGELHQEVVNYMYNYVQARTSNKGKKKLEKALTQSKDDINHLNDKLLNVQKEIEDRDEKIQQLLKQVDVRNLEINKFRSAVEVAKKGNHDIDKLQEEVRRRDETIRELQRTIGQLQIDLGQEEHTTKMANSRVADTHQESNMKVEQLQRALEERNIEMEEAKRRLQRQLEGQMVDLRENHGQEIDDLRSQHADELKKLTDDLDTMKNRLINTQNQADQRVESAERAKRALEEAKAKALSLAGEESLASQRYLEDDKVKKDKKGKKSLARGKEAAAKKDSKAQGNKKSDSKKSQNKQTKKVGQKDSKEYADQLDEDDSPERAKTEQNFSDALQLEPVPENINKEFDDEFQLDDEKSWASVPPEDVYGRFAQFRSRAREVIADLSEQVEETVRRTTRKIDLIKEQFQEHKSRWEEEKESLLKQLAEAQQLQQTAEEEANQAVVHMEGYIEQEEVLDEEEEKKTKALTDKEEKAVEANETDERPSSNDEAAAADESEITPESEAEMQSKLLDMTDDAKVLSRQKSRDSPSRESAADEDSTTSLDVADKGTSPFSKKKRSVSFSASLPKKSDWLDPEQRIIIDSLKQMLASKEDFTDAQESALEVLRGELLTEDMVKESGALLVYCLACHLAHQSIVMGIDPTSLLRTLAHFTALSFNEADKMTFVIPETPKLSLKDLRRLKSYRLIRQVSENELKESISGETVDEVRESSAKSRRSLRDQHRNSLSSLKADAEGHQSRSIGSAHSVKSSGSNIDLSEDIQNHGEVAENLGKGDYQDIATSPITSNDMLETGNLSSLANHPLMETFLKTYNGIANFKDNLSQVFMDKEMTSASQELDELELVAFNKDEKVQPQIEQMISSAYQIFDKCVDLLGSLLGQDRPESHVSWDFSDYNASATNTSKAQSNVETRADSLLTSSKSEQASSESLRRELQGQLQNLQEQYLMLQRQFDENAKKYEGQMQRKTKAMMEMQDTINTLRQEVANLNKQLLAKPEPVNLMDSPLMFTRMDSERNAKILKRAVNEKRIPHDKYTEAVNTMESYVSLPAKRLAHLVRKYLHHTNMRNIERNLQKSRHLPNPQVVSTLGKMEALESAKAQKWAEQMDVMGTERLELATSLMSTLDDIEQDSGIFLIKPFYSYKGSTNNTAQKLKLNRRPPLRDQPHVTPASHVRTVQQLQNQGRPNSRQNENQGGLAGKASNIETLHNSPVWMPRASQTYDDFYNSVVEVPKIMELDVNRMLIPQNQISMKVVPSALSDDRLTNAANASVRSYIAVNRPTRLPEVLQHPSQSFAVGPETNDVQTPPVTREASTVSNNQKSAREVDRQRTLPSTPPLPPIAQSALPFDEGNDAPLPPASPPGSSIRQTPSTRHSAKFSLPSEADG